MEKFSIDSHIKVHIYNNGDSNCPAFNFLGTVTRVIPQERKSKGDTLFDHLGIEFSQVKKPQRELLQENTKTNDFQL